MEPVSIATSAILVDLSISTWTARKLDKAVSDEVNTSKRANKLASRVNKSLFPGVKQLDVIIKRAAALRSWVHANSLPWSDLGTRLIPTATFFDFQKEFAERRQEFDDAVEAFVTAYPTLISAQAFQLGDMFNRDEYPSPAAVASKFAVNIAYSPVPEAADFRVDVGRQALIELQDQYENVYEERLNEAMTAVRSRLLKSLQHLSDRMTDAAPGESKKFHSTILDTFASTVAGVRQLNITKDEALDALAAQAEAVVAGVDVESVRKDEHVRADVKARVDALLDNFAI